MWIYFNSFTQISLKTPGEDNYKVERSVEGVLSLPTRKRKFEKVNRAKYKLHRSIENTGTLHTPATISIVFFKRLH